MARSEVPTLYTLPQVAKRLEVKLRTVQRLVASGEIRTVQVTSRIRRVTDAELAAFIAARSGRSRRGAA